ncbi:MAG: thioesterase family protein [Candidatus Omnitrophota bacterium]|jgi:acyl-CoA thioester hydrolase
MKIHESEVRVRYQETDNMGVVYYSNYLVWFEIARTEYFRALGLVYRKLEEKGIYLMVAAISCKYKSPAKYDDIVRMQAWISELKNSSLKFEYKLFVGDKLIATGDSIHVFTNSEGRPRRIPEEVRNLFHP